MKKITTKKRKTNKQTASTKKVTKRDYLYACGKRKSAVARVRYYPKSKTHEIIINQKDIKEYTISGKDRKKITLPLKITGQEKGKFSIKTNGGGMKSQVDAIRLGIAKVLVINNSDLKLQLKKLKLLTRDSRVKERKKPGLKKARRAPQWSKR